GGFYGSATPPVRIRPSRNFGCAGRPRPTPAYPAWASSVESRPGEIGCEASDAPRQARTPPAPSTRDLLPYRRIQRRDGPLHRPAPARQSGLSSTRAAWWPMGTALLRLPVGRAPLRAVVPPLP